MNIFLDDIRQPSMAYNYTLDSIYLKESWTIVQNYDEFTRVIDEYYSETTTLPDIISFDHDLADIHYDPKTWTEGFVYQEKTGYDCAKWLIDFCIDNQYPLPRFLCHSQNPVGKEKILGILTSYLKHQTSGQERETG